MTPHDRARRLLAAHARHTGVSIDGLFLLSRPHGDTSTRHVRVDAGGMARSVLE